MTINNSILNNASINPNARNNPVVDDVRYSNRTVERVSKIAMPFLNLYQPTALAVTVSLGSVKIWQNLSEAVQNGQKGAWKQCGNNVAQVSLVIASISLSILAPTAGLIVSHGSQIAVNVHTLAISLWKGNFREAGTAALSTAHTFVYIAASVYAAPELLAISLLSQALVELYHARQEIAAGNFPEAVANIAMALIRMHQAKPHLQTCQRNWLGKEMTQAELDNFLEKIWSDQINHPEKTVDFEQYLVDKNLSSYLKNLNFDKPFQEQQQVHFNRIHFKDCQIGSMKSCVFNQSTFYKCSFKSAQIFQTAFMNTVFADCSLDNAVFYNNNFQQVCFYKNDMSRASFADSTFNRTAILSSKLFETSFIGARVKQTLLFNDDLTDTLLAGAKKDFTIFGSTPHKITRPVIGIAWNFKKNGVYASMDVEALKTYDPIILKFEYSPDDVDALQLDQEVRVEIAGLERESDRSFLSIPDGILKRAKQDSQIANIKYKAREIMDNVDALLIPGGLDIEPEFYGHSKSLVTYTESDYRRSMLEFALLQQANDRRIPTMGICRGSQMGNVFFGGTLKQHVDDQKGVFQRLEVVNGKALETIGVRGVQGLSMHHQASDQIGKDLSVVLKYDDVPKALISNDGNFLFTQFHPEIFCLESLEMPLRDRLANKKFFDYLVNKAQLAHDQKQIA